MVGHYFAKTGKNPEQSLYDYAVGSNGVFVHAKRKNLEACLPLTTQRFIPGLKLSIRGLQEIKSFVNIPERISLRFFTTLLDIFKRISPEEAVFYGHRTDSHWTFLKPAQIGTLASVKPIDPFAIETQDAIIEFHSHGSGRAFFSGTDDRDETGFRIYAVVGNFVTGEWPEILVRVGIFGHHIVIPADKVFELPGDIYDRFANFDRLP